MPPTERNARTGEFTPPGIAAWARAKSSSFVGAFTRGLPLRIQSASSTAQYVSTASAPARRMPRTDSITARLRSIQPWAAAASIIAYSPDTW